MSACSSTTPIGIDPNTHLVALRVGVEWRTVASLFGRLVSVVFCHIEYTRTNLTSHEIVTHHFLLFFDCFHFLLQFTDFFLLFIYLLPLFTDLLPMFTDNLYGKVEVHEEHHRSHAVLGHCEVASSYNRFQHIYMTPPHTDILIGDWQGHSEVLWPYSQYWDREPPALDMCQDEWCRLYHSTFQGGCTCFNCVSNDCVLHTDIHNHMLPLIMNN